MKKMTKGSKKRNDTHDATIPMTEELVARKLAEGEFRKGELIKAANGQTTDLYDKQGRPVWGVNEQGQAVCYGPKSNGEGYDMSPVRMANGRCRLHGGNSLVGAAHPRAKDLGRSKLRHLHRLPEIAANMFEETEGDKQLVDVRPEIRLVDTRIAMLEESLSDQNAIAAVRAIRDAWSKFDQAVLSGDKDRVSKCEKVLRKAINEGGADDDTWEQIIKLCEQRRKFIETELKRQAQAEQMIPAATLREYTIRIIGIMRGSVIENVNRETDRMIDKARLGLIGARVDPEMINVTMAVFAPVIIDQMKHLHRVILRDAASGIGGLWQGSNALPSASDPL